MASHGMSKDACLSLECQNFVVLGSYGEACFGEPVPIDEVEDLRLWSEGLRQDGGAGSVVLSMAELARLMLIAKATS
jgi:hypothetical protein